jgi:orotate phosphoribosyltransferase
MTEDILNEFRAADALLEGHFILSSGLHSAMYLQCARVMMCPERGARLCHMLAQKVKESLGEIDICISPAMGGVIVGYEMARQLGVESLFVERVNGQFELRRGFHIPEDARILMVEDVVTTGLSSRECIETIQAHNGNVVGGCCLVDRSNGTANIGVPLVSLIQLNIPSYSSDNLPEELTNIPVVKPGSRFLRK